MALVLRYLAGGRYELGEAAPVDPGLLLGIGLLFAGGTGVVGLLLGAEVLQTAILEAAVPLLGDVKLVTSLFFDMGVYLIVVGLVLDILRSLGAELDRQVDEDPEQTDRAKDDEADRKVAAEQLVADEREVVEQHRRIQFALAVPARAETVGHLGEADLARGRGEQIEQRLLCSRVVARHVAGRCQHPMKIGFRADRGPNRDHRRDFKRARGIAHAERVTHGE